MLTSLGNKWLLAIDLTVMDATLYKLDVQSFLYGTWQHQIQLERPFAGITFSNCYLVPITDEGGTCAVIILNIGFVQRSTVVAIDDGFELPWKVEPYDDEISGSPFIGLHVTEVSLTYYKGCKNVIYIPGFGPYAKVVIS